MCAITLFLSVVPLQLLTSSLMFPILGRGMGRNPAAKKQGRSLIKEVQADQTSKHTKNNSLLAVRVQDADWSNARKKG